MPDFEWRNTEEKPRKHAAHGCCKDHTDNRSDRGEGQSFTQDHSDDIGSLRAECETNADLAGPTSDRVCQHAVNPDPGEHHSDESETARNRCCGALRCHAKRNGVVERLRSYDR